MFAAERVRVTWVWVCGREVRETMPKKGKKGNEQRTKGNVKVSVD